MSHFHILVAIDGSDDSLAAVQHALDDARTRHLPVHIHLVNVQPALPNDVTRFVNRDDVQAFHREAGQQALAKALETLAGTDVAHTAHVLVGEAAPSLVQFAKEHGCKAIVIGTRGLGGIAGWLMGSVATRVAHLSEVPVVLIRNP